MSKTKTLPKHATDGVLEEAWMDTARKDVQAGGGAYKGSGLGLSAGAWLPIEEKEVSLAGKDASN
jgi:hypothetical protein